MSFGQSSLQNAPMPAEPMRAIQNAAQEAVNSAATLGARLHQLLGRLRTPPPKAVEAGAATGREINITLDGAHRLLAENLAGAHKYLDEIEGLL